MILFLLQFISTVLVIGEVLAAAIHHFDSVSSGRTAGPSIIRDYAEAALGNFLATLVAMALCPWAIIMHKRREFDPNGGPPICLVSGTLWGWGGPMYGLYKSLRAKGARNVYILPVAFSRGAIDRMADNLCEELERFSSLIGGEKPYLVAHGIAGLAARLGPSQSPGRYCQATFTVATPHHGTRLAVFMPGQLGFQLQPGSPLLQALNHEPGDCVLTFHSPLDSQIIPAESACFGQRVSSLGGSGHLSILWNAQLCEQILSEITSAPSS
ncbi:MAG: hypothetical protein HOI23_11675 [Deltaproteobacteria bacterium]|jgi:hypothetical protein|nr:hypothetical protein [Deltaproteobacteria bacterium]MBT6491909.1 hypothetical protein [Deltaproteobacteria bacterium]